MADGGYMTLDLKIFFSLETALEILKQPALDAYQFSIFWKATIVGSAAVLA
jgi:hypothetical protein